MPDSELQIYNLNLVLYLLGRKMPIDEKGTIWDRRIRGTPRHLLPGAALPRPPAGLLAQTGFQVGAILDQV